MKLKAKCTIFGKADTRAKPGEVFDAVEFGISAAEADVLVTTGRAEHVVEAAPAEESKPKAKAVKAGGDGAAG